MTRKWKYIHKNYRCKCTCNKQWHGLLKLSMIWSFSVIICHNSYVSENWLNKIISMIYQWTVILLYRFRKIFIKNGFQKYLHWKPYHNLIKKSYNSCLSKSIFLSSCENITKYLNCIDKNKFRGFLYIDIFTVVFTYLLLSLM